MDYKIYIVLILLLILGYLLCSNYFKNNQQVQQIVQNENFASTKKKPVLKLYYTNWCGWSKKFLPVWQQLEGNLPIQMEKIDCEKNPEKCQGVAGFPFIVLERENNRLNYNGNRTVNDIKRFVQNNAN
jgi:hypothetical protein